MPVREEEYVSGSLFPFFSSLLAEGSNRALQERLYRLNRNDDWGLLPYDSFGDDPAAQQAMLEGGKYAREDFASLAGLNREESGENDKHDVLSYAEGADVIRRNSSVPKVDLLNTGIHLPGPIFALTKGLFKEGTSIRDTTVIGHDMLARFGIKIGLKEKMVDRELTRFASPDAGLEQLIETSQLSERVKELYWKEYCYRRSTLDGYEYDYVRNNRGKNPSPPDRVGTHPAGSSRSVRSGSQHSRGLGMGTGQPVAQDASGYP